MKKFMIGGLVLLMMNCSTDIVLSDEAQLKKDVATIDKYLVDSKVTAIQDPSGMRLVVHDAGTLPFPVSTSKLTVIYKGTFLSGGGQFDESTSPPKQFVSPLSELIKGWQIGFGYVAKGGKATFYIPSGLAYGKAGTTNIPPNANLVFEVDLVGFTF